MSSPIFQNCRILIVPNGLLKKRMKLFEEQVTKNGGLIVLNGKNTLPTHIIIEESYFLDPRQVENLLKAVDLNPNESSSNVVSTLWLSRCLKEKSLVDVEDFKFKSKRTVEDEVLSKDEKSPKIQQTEIISSNHSSTKHSGEESGFNEVIIREFQKLAEAYRVNGEVWRTKAYDKALASLKSLRKPISNINDLKSLPHISAKMLDRILEIIENGYCSKIEEICSDEKTQVLEVFYKVWGAGPVTALTWYQKGCRTLEDLRTKVDLTWQQELGIKYYNEIQKTLPRQEVELIVDYVKRVAHQVDNTLKVMACGSFRRGKLMCGDIDVLVIAQDTTNVLHRIISILKNEDFLIDDLSIGKDKKSTTYLGLCKLPGEKNEIRRLDIFVIKNSNMGCALVHYTGSKLFNQGIRIHAAKMNMKLTEYHLKFNGQILSTPFEESVFEHLKLEYKHPEDRETF